jgi:hypothetical protein
MVDSPDWSSQSVNTLNAQNLLPVGPYPVHANVTYLLDVDLSNLGTLIVILEVNDATFVQLFMGNADTGDLLAVWYATIAVQGGTLLIKIPVEAPAFGIVLTNVNAAAPGLMGIYGTNKVLDTVTVTGLVPTVDGLTSGFILNTPVLVGSGFTSNGSAWIATRINNTALQGLFGYRYVDDTGTNQDNYFADSADFTTDSSGGVALRQQIDLPLGVIQWIFQMTTTGSGSISIRAVPPQS